MWTRNHSKVGRAEYYDELFRKIMKRTTTNLFWPFLSFSFSLQRKKERWVGGLCAAAATVVGRKVYFFSGPAKKKERKVTIQ
jgi:hypothetical protein